MCFYFTLEFLIYLDLFSVSVGIKTCPCRICYEWFTFSKQRRIWSFHVVVLQRTAKKCTKNYNARAQLLFCSLNLLFGAVLVGVAVVFCVRSLMAHEGHHQSPLELITHNVRSILADVLNKVECEDVDHSIDFREWHFWGKEFLGLW